METVKSQKEKQPDRLPTNSTKSKYEHASRQDHEPSRWDRSEKCDDTKEKKKNTHTPLRPKWEEHNTLKPWMDPYLVKYFSELLLICFV